MITWKQSLRVSMWPEGPTYIATFGVDDERFGWLLHPNGTVQCQGCGNFFYQAEKDDWARLEHGCSAVSEALYKMDPVRFGLLEPTNFKMENCDVIDSGRSQHLNRFQGGRRNRDQLPQPPEGPYWRGDRRAAPRRPHCSGALPVRLSPQR